MRSLTITAAEEKYDAVMENHVELEETLHNLGIRTLAFVERHYEEMIAPLNLVREGRAPLLAGPGTVSRPLGFGRSCKGIDHGGEQWKPQRRPA